MSQGFAFKVFKFALIGALASALYAIMAWSLIAFTALSPTLASLIAYCLAIPASYVGQKYFTFKSRGRLAQETPRFALTQVLGMAIATGVMAITEYNGIHTNWGILAVIIAVPAISFILMNRFVFSSPQPS